MIGLGGTFDQLNEVGRRLCAQMCFANTSKRIAQLYLGQGMQIEQRRRAIRISVSKNKSSLPANGLRARRAPLATVWTQPNDSVHQEKMTLVSLNFRLRKRIANVLSTSQSVIAARALRLK